MRTAKDDPASEHKIAIARGPYLLRKTPAPAERNKSVDVDDRGGTTNREEARVRAARIVTAAS